MIPREKKFYESITYLGRYTGNSTYLAFARTGYAGMNYADHNIIKSISGHDAWDGLYVLCDDGKLVSYRWGWVGVHGHIRPRFEWGWVKQPQRISELLLLKAWPEVPTK